MTLSEFEIKRTEKIVGSFVEQRRPEPAIRDQLDIGFRLTGQSVELFTIRPVWNMPEKKIESSIAKATWVKNRKTWRVSWHRADMKWHSYPPNPEVSTIEQFLKIVADDTHGCFWG